MKHSDTTTDYANLFSICEDNRVRGFDPLRFVRMTAGGPKLELGTKKVWFRLKYPEGRILLHSLSITEQMALIEARIFLNKSDPAPTFTSTVQKRTDEVPGGLYIQAAQHEAIHQVLDKAGFTVMRKGGPSPAIPAKEPVRETVAEVTPPERTVEDKVLPPAETLPTPPAETTVGQTNEVEPETVPAQPVTEHHTEILSMPEVPPVTVRREPVAAEVSYTTSTSVDEILAKMSVQEALDYIVTSGACSGWTMSQVLSRRPASMKFYASSNYKGNDNILRAAAKILLAENEKNRAG